MLRGVSGGPLSSEPSGKRDPGSNDGAKGWTTPFDGEVVGGVAE